MRSLTHGQKAAIGFVLALPCWIAANFAWRIAPVALSMLVLFISVVCALAATGYMLFYLMRMAKGR
jgi:hypothetical protein